MNRRFAPAFRFSVCVFVLCVRARSQLTLRIGSVRARNKYDILSGGPRSVPQPRTANAISTRNPN